MCQPKVLEETKQGREMGRDCRKSVFVTIKARGAKNPGFNSGIKHGVVQASFKL